MSTFCEIVYPRVSGYCGIYRATVQMHSRRLCSNTVKCKKHFIKMLKYVGMVVPKIKETRL